MSCRALLYCVVLYCTVLCCVVLCCTVLYCAVLSQVLLWDTLSYCTEQFLLPCVSESVSECGADYYRRISLRVSSIYIFLNFLKIDILLKMG